MRWCGASLHSTWVPMMLSVKPPADVNARNLAGSTPLFTYINSSSDAPLLLEAKANVNAVDNQGNTALLFAVKFGMWLHDNVVEALVAAGVDVSIKNHAGETALTAASVDKHGEEGNASTKRCIQKYLATKDKPKAPTTSAASGLIQSASIITPAPPPTTAQRADSAPKPIVPAPTETPQTLVPAFAEPQTQPHPTPATTSATPVSAGLSPAELESALRAKIAAESETGKGTSGAWAKQFTGDFECPVPRDQLEERVGQVWAKTLDEKNEADAKLLSTVNGWLQPHTFPKGQGVKSVEVVFSPARYRLFLGQLEALEHRQSSPAFQPHLEQESNPAQRAAVLAHLDSLARQVQHNRKIRIVRVWHGTNANVLEHILEDGFAAIATLDDGWFGKGIYLTSSAKYALRYCKNPRVLVLCYALLLNPYPLVADDATADKEPEQFAQYGRGNHKNYQCHYARVSPSEPMPTMDFRPPADPSSAIFDELVIFQEACILPQIVVHLT